MNNGDYISFKKLCKAIRKIYNFDKLNREYYQLGFNELVLGSFGSYALDYYDYKNSRLVISERDVFIHLDDNRFFVYKYDDDIIIKSENNDDYYIKNIVLDNKDFFIKAIDDFEKYRDFHTKHIKDGFIIDAYKSSRDYYLNLNNYSISFATKSDISDDDALSYTYYYSDGSRRIDGDNSIRVRYCTDFENTIKKRIMVDKRALPEWCLGAIRYCGYDKENLVSKALNRFSNTKKNQYDKIKRQMLYDNKSKKDYPIVKSNSSDDYDRVKIDNNILFKRVDDHFEINDTYKDNLKYVDLSDVDFSNVLVSGINFTDTNINYFDPQKVFNKDLSYSRFGDIDNKDNAIPFSIYTDFNGVNLSGTVILGDTDFRYNLDGAITDSNTKIIYNHSVDKTKKKK